MLALIVLLLVVAVGAVERIITAKAHAAERAHLLAIITAAQVSPAAAAVAARPPVEPRSRPEAIVQAM